MSSLEAIPLELIDEGLQAITGRLRSGRVEREGLRDHGRPGKTTRRDQESCDLQERERPRNRLHLSPFTKPDTGAGAAPKRNPDGCVLSASSACACVARPT